MIERNVMNLCVKCYIVIWLVRRIIEIVFCRKYNLLLEILGYKKGERDLVVEVLLVFRNKWFVILVKIFGY